MALPGKIPFKSKPRKFSTAKAQIESTPKISGLEMHWFKNFGEELREAVILRKPTLAVPNYSKIGSMQVYSKPKYLRPALPNFLNLIEFNAIRSRSLVVAAIGLGGKVAGYTMISKAKPHYGRAESARLLTMSPEKTRYYDANRKLSLLREEVSVLNAFPDAGSNKVKLIRFNAEMLELGETMTKCVKESVWTLGWKIRFVPMKGYEFRHGYFLPRENFPVSANAEKIRKETEKINRARNSGK